MRANQLRLWLSSMAYVLVSALRRIALAATRFVVLSQKVARFDFENQLFEKIQDWRGRC